MSEEEKAREYYNIFVFKVEPCPQKNKHPWDGCDYCHPQENARRRDVRKFRYLAEACPDYKLHGFCALGSACPFAHGVFEINLHPAKYRTQICTEGPRCNRKVCFFAHNEAQLRQPDYSYGYRTSAEAEHVRQQLLDGGRPGKLQVRAGMPVSPIQRVSPVQGAPSTPPQIAPPRAFNVDRAAGVADAFRTLPLGASQPSSLPGSAATDVPYSLPLYGLQGWPGAGGDGGVQSSQMQDVLATSVPGIDPASAQMLCLKATSQTRSLPVDAGPRISMKVRRELGLEPPPKQRTHSLPGLGQNLQAAQAGIGMPSLLGSSSLIGHSPSASQAAGSASGSLPQMPGAVGSLPRLSNSLPGLAPPANAYKPLRILPHGHAPATLRVVAPNGVTMDVDEAMAQLKVNNGTGRQVGNDLSQMASALSFLSRLGYSLAADTGSPSPSDRVSSQSSPDAFSAMPQLSGMAARLDLNHAGGSLLSVPASAPGLAGFGLSSGSGKSYNLFS